MEISDITFKKNSSLSVKARKSGNHLYGQKYHNQHIHKYILSEYSKSVALAPKDSGNVELAIAYGNRSALLMHLSEYEKCLLDVDRALKITESTEFKSKLATRKAKCLAAIKSSTNVTNATLNLPNFRRSLDIPYASEAITVKYNDKFGRHLVATRYIKPGEPIIVEKGYVCFPSISRRHTICSHCLSFAWNGIPCDHCAFVVYCSEKCKIDAWDEYHDIECSLLPLVPIEIFENEQFFLPYLIVAVRLLIKAIKREGIDTVINEFYNGEKSKGVDHLKSQFCSDTFESIINLLGHEDTNRNNHLKYGDSMLLKVIESLCRHTNLLTSKGNQNDNIAKTISQLKAILEKLTDIVDDNVFEYQAFVCECDNTFVCKSTCDSTRGVVLAPFSSLMNHSCNSNVRRMFLPNGKIVMFTVAPVKKGEQLFTSYGTLHTEKKEYRQKFLQKLFHFTCQCQACEENWPSDPRQAELDEYTEARTILEITIDFKKHFPSVKQTTIMNVSEDDWEFDEETLKHAIKLSELTYKHFNNVMLFSYYNDKYKNYISSAFHALYGEKFAIPDNCL